MADVLELRLEGMDKLLNTLNELPFVMRRDMEPVALRALGNVIKNLAKSKAPVGKVSDYWGRGQQPGGLKKGIKVRIIKAKTKLDETEGFVYVDADVFWSHMVEFGHWILTPRKRAPRETVRAKRKGARVRFVAPKPFMRPAVDEGKIPGFAAAGLAAERKMPGILRKVGV